MAASRVAEITSASDRHYRGAVDLLVRFFEEGGFATPRERVAQNLHHLVGDDGCWTAVLVEEGKPVGVVTVSTTFSVELGRLAEIGDLYVTPARRGRGLARRLVGAAIEWSRERNCDSILVTVTAEGEARHRLSDFYKRLAFAPTGRTTMMLAGSISGDRQACSTMSRSA
jgi:GNAT superfamily N-acetyltransferase